MACPLWGPVSKQNLPADLQHKAWTAQWVAVSGAAPTAYDVYHFRKLLEPPHKPDAYILHVSGDNRYKFYVNGTFI